MSAAEHSPRPAARPLGGPPPTAFHAAVAAPLAAPGDAPCAQRWLRGPYRETLAVRDGRQVLLRPAHHRDAPALQRFFASLSPRARLLRFHGAFNTLPDAAARQLSTQVPQRHVALLAWVDAPGAAAPEPGLVAEARYAVDVEADPEAAEFGLAVADPWQGQGLGRALLWRLAVHARASGLRRLRGSVMAGNEPMIGLLRALGATLRGDAGEVVGTLAL